MKVAASPRSRAQVAAVLAFVISHTTFLAAQDDETGRCPKVVFKLQVTSHKSPVTSHQSTIPISQKRFDTATSSCYSR